MSREYDFADFDEIDDKYFNSFTERTVNALNEEIPVDVALAPRPRQVIRPPGRRPKPKKHSPGFVLAKRSRGQG